MAESFKSASPAMTSFAGSSQQEEAYLLRIGLPFEKHLINGTPYAEDSNGNSSSDSAQQQNESVSATGQQNSTYSSGHPIDKDAIANYADPHADKGSLHKCATYCRKAFEAGGVDTSGYPVSAKDWGPTLLKNGATVIPQDGYSPAKADVAVFAGTSAHRDGHIAIYDGKQWVSPFVQHHMSPYSPAGTPPVTVYRFPDN